MSIPALAQRAYDGRNAVKQGDRLPSGEPICLSPACSEWHARAMSPDFDARPPASDPRTGPPALSSIHNLQAERSLQTRRTPCYKSSFPLTPLSGWHKASKRRLPVTSTSLAAHAVSKCMRLYRSNSDCSRAIPYKKPRVNQKTFAKKALPLQQKTVRRRIFPHEKTPPTSLLFQRTFTVRRSLKAVISLLSSNPCAADASLKRSSFPPLKHPR